MKKIKMKEAIKLVLKEDTTFDLYFLDGVVKRYNILSLAKKFPQLTALKDRKLFEQGKLLGWGGVVWNDELDVSSETVYKYGKNVSKEYDDIDSVVLGYKIKVKRTMRLMTQEELAKKIGIDQSDLSKIEKGTANPSLKTLSKIAKGLNAKLSLL
jgi:DNA-binding XRE family transcriptional regulator